MGEGTGDRVGARGHDGFRRRWMLRAAALLSGVLAPLAAAELLLQLHPSTSDSPWRMPVDEERPIARYEPDRQFTWSRDWNFSIVNTVNVNNAGFVSDVDYEADAPGPLLAVVGNSFVEALQVPYRQSCAGRLATMLEPAARVYPFALGGSSYSQYLVWARYARDAFRPQGLVVVVSSGVFHYSLIEFARLSGYHYFTDRGASREGGGGGRLVLERIDFVPHPAFRLARQSALVRYLVYNLGFPWSFQRFLTRLTTGSVPLDPRDDPASTDRLVAASERVIDAFLDMLPAYSGLAPERILFVVDGDSRELYVEDTAARQRLEDETHRYFMANAGRRGHEVIDLSPRMRAHWRKHRQRFDWPQDAHWNPLGHEQCFMAVRSSDLLSDEFPRPPSGAADAG